MRSIARLAAIAAFLLPASFGFAQIVYDTPGGRIPMDLATGPYNEWPRTTTATPAGVNSSATGTATLTAPNGTKVPVPVTATASIPKADIAKAAAKRAALGGVGAALTIEAVADELIPGNGGYVKCGFMDLFLCEVTEFTGGPPVTAYFMNTQRKFTTPEYACQDRVTTTYSHLPGVWTYAILQNPLRCQALRDGQHYNIIGITTLANGVCAGDNPELPGTNPDTSKPLEDQCGVLVPVEVVPATEESIEQSLQEKMDADYQAAMRLWDAMKADQAAAAAAGQTYPASHDPVNANTPVSVNAPPVTSPERTTKVETIPRSDGSTDTATTKETTTVEPQTTGTKYGDTKTTFPSKTTSTTTVVNNVTNNTTTSTTVVNHPAMQVEDGPHPDLPNDYAREKTLQETRDALKTAGAADMADQGAVVEASKTKNDADLDTLFSDSETGVDADKARFFSWVWTPPVGVCAPFSGTVSGFTVSWDLCPTIENINAVIGWLFALFSAMTVYGQLFKRND